MNPIPNISRVETPVRQLSPETLAECKLTPTPSALTPGKLHVLAGSPTYLRSESGLVVAQTSGSRAKEDAASLVLAWNNLTPLIETLEAREEAIQDFEDSVNRLLRRYSPSLPFQMCGGPSSKQIRAALAAAKAETQGGPVK